MAWLEKNGKFSQKSTAPPLVETPRYESIKPKKEPVQGNLSLKEYEKSQKDTFAANESTGFPEFSPPPRQTTFEQAALEQGDAASMSSSAASDEHNHGQPNVNAQPKKRISWNWKQALKRKTRKA
jgi:hypothetical protein